jgi:hypothetical protein
MSKEESARSEEQWARSTQPATREKRGGRTPLLPGSPQGLKAASTAAQSGTAEAVPFYKTIYEMRAEC